MGKGLMLAFFQDRGHDCVEIKRFQILVMIGVSIFAVFLANPEWNEIWTIAARFILLRTFQNSCSVISGIFILLPMAIGEALTYVSSVQSLPN